MIARSGLGVLRVRHAQDSREITLHIGDQFGPIRIGRQYDLVNQATDCLGRFLSMFCIIQRFHKVTYGRCVSLRHVWVHENRRFLVRFEKAFYLQFLRFQGFELGLHEVQRNTVQHCLVRLLHLALDLGELPLTLRPRSVPLMAHLIQVARIFFAKHLREFWVH
ncbi:MAG: hypothetical protein QNJ16_06270 [Rhodobacter sp.]|nr:hypothetical protein [Rhodobacter sp.]